MDIEDWEEVQLQDVAKELTVGYVGTMTSEYVDCGIPFLRSKNVQPFGIKWDDMRYIGRDFHKKLNKSSLSPGDVVIVRTGKPGAAAIIPENLLEANCSDLVIIRPGSTLNARFLVYYLNSLGSHHINSHLVGAVQQHFNIGSARTLRFKLPPLPEQKAIAHILGTLDDKIELNKQMNETLEAIARAIFKSWFVDFDPVRAKMEGKQPPGMDAATADLFPDEFEESSLGLIPKGWRVGTLGDVCEFAYGKTLKKESRKNGNIPVYGSNGQIGWHDEALVNSPGVIVGRKGNPGIVKYSHTSFYPIDTTFYIIPKATVMSMQYFFHYLSFLDLASLDGDSAVPGLNRHMAYMSNILIPPTNILDFFERYTLSFADQIYSNAKESHTLATIRDTLLPKLMSGEIRVKEAEKILHGVS